MKETVVKALYIVSPNTFCFELNSLEIKCNMALHDVIVKKLNVVA